jgi:hemin uptake protein HemP
MGEQRPMESDDRNRQGGAEAPAPRVLDARQLFGSDKEVVIEHAGVRYRLRLTRRGRLILTK